MSTKLVQGPATVILIRHHLKSLWAGFRIRFVTEGKCSVRLIVLLELQRRIRPINISAKTGGQSRHQEEEHGAMKEGKGKGISEFGAKQCQYQ
jgi:hypothetical protein